MQSSSIYIQLVDMNEILDDPGYLERVRELTLKPTYGLVSGMNHEINNLQMIKTNRFVKAHAILGYLNGQLVGWALCSQEPSNFYFMTNTNFSGDGVLFEVYISSSARNKGVASALFHKAAESFPNEKLYVCPWNDVSYRFYEKHQHIPHQVI